MTFKDALSEMADAAGIETKRTKATGPVDEPEFQVDAMGHYIFTWRDDGVRIVVSNLERRSREFQGYLEALYRPPNGINGVKPTRLLSRTRVNLESMTGRESLVRALNRGMDRAWAVRIEQVHALCADYYQQGDPLVWLAETPEPGPAVYLALPYCEVGQHTIWFGDGGSGKSLLAEALAISVAEVRDILPDVQLRPAAVLYLDWETDRDTHRRRHAGMLRGIAPRNPKNFAYKRMVGPLVDGIEELTNLVQAHRIGLVIADSVTVGAGGDTNESATAAAYFRAARAIGATWLSVAHIPKTGGDGHRPFGSTAWHNLARSTWEITGQQEEGINEIHTLFQHRKNNNGPLAKARAYRCQFAEDAVLISTVDPTNKADLEKRLPLTRRIQNLLRDEPGQTAKEIADALDESERNVHNRLLDNQGALFERRGGARPFQWANHADDTRIHA